MRSELQALQAAHEKWLRSEYPRDVGRAEKEALRLLLGSIEYRNRSLRYHLSLIRDIEESALHLHTAEEDRDLSFQLLQRTAEHLSFLFDDVVFNAMSLFDYIGCLVGLICESRGQHQIDWTKGIGKAKAAGAAQLAETLQAIDKPFVDSLRRYRSEVIHYRRDNVGGYIKRDLLTGRGSDLRVTLPQWFSRTVRLDSGEPVPWSGTESILESAQILTERAEREARSALEALAEFSHRRPNVTAASSPLVLASRWIRDGLLNHLKDHPGVAESGVSRIAARFSEGGIVFLVFFGENASSPVETSQSLVELDNAAMSAKEAAELYAKVILEASRPNN